MKFVEETDEAAEWPEHVPSIGGVNGGLAHPNSAALVSFR